MSGEAGHVRAGPGLKCGGCSLEKGAGKGKSEFSEMNALGCVPVDGTAEALLAAAGLVLALYIDVPLHM